LTLCAEPENSSSIELISGEVLPVFAGRQAPFLLRLVNFRRFGRSACVLPTGHGSQTWLPGQVDEAGFSKAHKWSITSCLGMSRDDSGSSLPPYAELEIVKKNPFATIDQSVTESPTILQ